MRCQGDSGINEPFGINKQDSGAELHIRELQNTIKDLENQVYNLKL